MPKDDAEFVKDLRDIEANIQHIENRMMAFAKSIRHDSDSYAAMAFAQSLSALVNLKRLRYEEWSNWHMPLRSRDLL